MQIVKANASHIPGMLRLLMQVELVHHAIRPDLFQNGGRKYGEVALEGLLQDADSPIFIAEEDGDVLGYCFCQLRNVPENAVFKPRKELYIDDLCVDEGCRGRGIAGALYRHAEGFAKAQGCGYVTLNVWCGNSAMEFYEHMGLRPRNVTMERALKTDADEKRDL